MNTYLFGHVNEETAYIVEDYPYGFRLRTEIRYWIETTKNGDRFVSQTLNPKNDKWNKPKKSTYNAVGVMFLDENNHVKWTGFSLGWDNEEKITEFLEKIGGIEKLNPTQVSKVKEGLAISRTQKYIKHEITNSTHWTPEEEEAHKREQEEVKAKIATIYQSERRKLG